MKQHILGRALYRRATVPAPFSARLSQIAVFKQQAQLPYLSILFLRMSAPPSPSSNPIQFSDTPTTRPYKRLRRSQTTPQSIITAARAITNPFSQLNLSPTLSHSTLPNIDLHALTGPTLTLQDFDWVFTTVAQLKDMYRRSSMGWKEREKKREIRHPHQRYLIAANERFGERLAYLSYRWDVEEGQSVMYVYELHVEQHVRGKRIAYALMKFAEELCRKLCVACIILTVFCENQPAMALYRNKLG